MKLTDEKLEKLMRPIIEKKLSRFGIESINIDCRKDSSGDEAIFMNIVLQKADGNSNPEELKSTKLTLETLLYENDDNRYFYFNSHFLAGIPDITLQQGNKAYLNFIKERERFYAN